VRDVVFGLTALACPIGMGAMMWFMSKGMRRDQTRPVSPSLEGLREEHRRVGAEIDAIESVDGAAQR
jgi:hypothetical protein